MKLLLLFIVLTFAGIVIQNPLLMVLSALMIIVTLLVIAVNQIKKEI